MKVKAVLVGGSVGTGSKVRSLGLSQGAPSVSGSWAFRSESSSSDHCCGPKCAWVLPGSPGCS